MWAEIEPDDMPQPRAERRLESAGDDWTLPAGVMLGAALLAVAALWKWQRHGNAALASQGAPPGASQVLDAGMSGGWRLRRLESRAPRLPLPF